MVDGDPIRRRGTAILVITIITVATLGILQSIPPGFINSNLSVRVAIIDSGIDIDAELQSRVVSQKSFVNASFGYTQTENDTMDSRPGNSRHGTYIAKIIAGDSPNAAIVNAKVVGSDNRATPTGIVEAIRWVVLEENCSVINLSLGLQILQNDIVGDAVKWAFHRGVNIVAAAGNDGYDGIAGSSIDSPAAYAEVIAVAGIDANLNLYGFSGRGPLRNRIMKPDVAAWGYYTDNGKTVFGTSFAAPVVCATIVKIISYCLEKGWSWTPGMIKSVLMISALQLQYEEWEVGAGLVDYSSALNYLDNAQKVDGLPLIAALNPTDGPFSFEHWFVNQTMFVPVSIFASSNTTFDLAYRGTDSEFIHGPSEITINQTGQILLEVTVIASDDVENVYASVTFISPNYLSVKTIFSFDAYVPYKKIAIDVSHTPWAIDSVFGQFRELALRINELGSSVDEIGSDSLITLDLLQRYDAIFVMDPCAWAYIMVNNTVEKTSWHSYTNFEIDTYVQYWEQGGGLFLVGLGNDTIDLSSANELFSAFNITLNYDAVPPISIIFNGIVSTTEIVKMHDHRVTAFIDSFDYNGCSLNYSGDAFELAWAEIFWKDENDTIYTENRTVLVGLENSKGGRLLATGSNFFLDNWALNNLYQSKENWKFVLQALYWLIHVLEP